jgi:hypothetical protein
MRNGRRAAPDPRRGNYRFPLQDGGALVEINPDSQDCRAMRLLCITRKRV